jgi:perosamine synthetase
MRRSTDPIPGFRPALDTRALLRSCAEAAVSPASPGPRTERFEQAFAALVGAPWAVALSSVRLGLHHALGLLGLPPGAGVLSTPLTVRPVLDAILAAGAQPLLVDIDPDTLSMDLTAARARLTPEVRAVLVTHLWGVPSDLTAIRRFSDEHGLVMIEDASQCLGGTVGGCPVGTVGDLGLFSLGLTKTLSALTGAALVTHDQALAVALRRDLRPLPRLGRLAFGRSAANALALRGLTHPRISNAGGATVVSALRRSENTARAASGARPATPGEPGSLAGVRTRFGDLQARAGLRCLQHWERDEAARRAITVRYRALLSDIPELRLPPTHPDRIPGSLAFPVFHPRAPELIPWLQRCGVEALPSAVDACHELPGWPELSGSLPVSSRLQRECIQLPLHATMSPGEVERVASSISTVSTTAGR